MFMQEEMGIGESFAMYDPDEGGRRRVLLCFGGNKSISALFG